MLAGEEPGAPGIYTDVAVLRRWIDAAGACLQAGVAAANMTRCPGAGTCTDVPQKGCATCNAAVLSRCATCAFPGWRLDNSTGVVRGGGAARRGCLQRQTGLRSQHADSSPPFFALQCLPTTCMAVPGMRCASCDPKAPLRCAACADTGSFVDARGTCVRPACLDLCPFCSACSAQHPWRCTACRQPGKYRLDARSGRCVPRARH